MPSETIVAVFDTAAHAEAAISDLVAQGISVNAIEHYAQPVSTAGSTASTAADTSTHRGLWAWLSGETDTTTTHHAVYDQTVRSGGTVVTVVTDTADADKVYGILESHEPVDLEERDAQYAAAGAYTSAAPVAATSAAGTTGTKAEEVIALSEETLQVGKRAVDRGITRVRRYVVERPVEETIRLRNESVSVFRRPVTAGATIGADAFSDREIVMTETDEEAVVAKSAHVVEEVVVQKGVEEHVETVRDTLRREEVEIDGPTHQAVTGATTGTSRTPEV